jgi:hypothetical protein
MLNIGAAPGSARSPTGLSGKANVDVRTKNGKASVKIVEILDGRRANLDVLTVKGVYNKFSFLLYISVTVFKLNY